MADDSEIDSYLDRLERLLVRFFRPRGGALALWNVQLDLLRLQQDVQAAISAAKESAKSQAKFERLNDLRRVRWRCRRFGDAIAWVFLNSDLKAIEPLSLNDPVPIPDRGPGMDGAIALATVLSDRRWGFPLLHDITDILRVGDISFVRPNEEPRTIEVKSRLTASDERSTAYTVSVVFHSDRGSRNPYPAGSVDADEFDALPTETDSKPAGSIVKSLTTGRARRQGQRMRDALARRDAEVGSVITVNSHSLRTIEVTLSNSGHFDLIRQVARGARRNGYARAFADDVFYYLGVYDSNGVTLESIPADRFDADVRSSGFLRGGGPHPDSMVIYSIPAEQDGRGPHTYLPFYLYDLPRSSIIDIMRGRLVLVVFVNGGRLRTALESAGLTLTAGPDGKAWPEGPVYIDVRETSPTGQEFRAQAGPLSLDIIRMVHEFRGIQYLVDIARTMDAEARQAIHQMPDWMDR